MSAPSSTGCGTVFADFRAETSGLGTSFKGALAYYLHDKVEGERPTTDERVDVLELRNLATDIPEHAWFEMMNTAEASAALKEAAGIPKGGRAGTKPVFTYYLSWADGERPDRAAMLDAAQTTLKKFGLLDHQAMIVSHTDTNNFHVHVIVNRVNPENGRYANLSNSWKTLKEFAVEYSKERGTSWHVPLEQAKQAREQRRQTSRQAGFNAGARATSPAGSSGRAAWTGQKTAGNDNRAGEEAAAAKLRATLDAKWTALREFEQGRAAERYTETAQFRADRKALRDAIYAKYAEAYEAIWKPRAGQPASRPSPMPDKVLVQLRRQRRTFETRERGLFGRLMNARQLAKGGSFLTVARLAMNGGERRRLFDLAQRKTASDGRWGKKVEQKVRADFAPEPKRFRADRLKLMRADELARFDRETQQLRSALAARQSQQTGNEKAMKAALSAEGKAAWVRHAAAHRPPTAKTQASQERAKAAPAEPAKPTHDRFGRSRDRKPRAPRAGRQDRAGRTSTGEATGRTEGPAGEAATAFNSEARHQPAAERASVALPGEAVPEWTEAQRERMAVYEAEQAAERANTHDDRGRGR